MAGSSKTRMATLAAAAIAASVLLLLFRPGKHDLCLGSDFFLGSASEQLHSLGRREGEVQRRLVRGRVLSINASDTLIAGEVARGPEIEAALMDESDQEGFFVIDKRSGRVWPGLSLSQARARTAELGDPDVLRGARKPARGMGWRCAVAG